MAHAGLGGRLRSAREAAGLSVAQVAAELRCDAKTLYRYEREEFEPSIGTLCILAALYRVTVNDLVYKPVARAS